LAAFLVLAALSGILCRGVRGMPWDVRLHDVFFGSAGGAGPTVGALCYGAALLAVYVLYFRLIKTFRQSRTHLGFALAVSVALHLILAVSTPSRSIDVYSYLAHGYNTGRDFHLAYVTPAYAVQGTPYGDALATIYRTPPDVHGPTPYGPVWTYFEYFAVRLTGLHVFRGALVLKLGTAAASLGTAVMIWRILAMTSPALQAAGVVTYLYNPLILNELVADGHNDAWMIFFVVAGLSFAVRRRLTAASFLLGLAVMTKYVPLLLFPAFLRYAWVSARARGLKDCAAGLAAGAAVFAALFAPLWAGAGGFGGVQRILGGTSAFGRLVLPAVHSPAAESALFAAALIGYLAFSISEGWKAEDAPRLFESGACVLLSYFLFFPREVWCWYAALPATLLLLNPRRNVRLFAYALSIVASINSPLWSFFGRQDLAIGARVVIQDWTCAGAMIALLLVYRFLPAESARTSQI
jgi:hypothetical protein